MEPDIQYLLFLQELRNATGGIFDEVFNGLSKMAVSVLPLIPYIVYWCVDKKWGQRLIATVWSAKTLNEAVKLTACVYRPWIRDIRIEPPGDAKAGATGYSFPSGHTVYATAVCGTIAAWQRVCRRWLSVLCVAMIIFVGFSRNWLGVHTPQDVLTGFLETAVFIFLTGRVQEWLEKNENWIDALTVAGIISVFIILFYVRHKAYPLDYVDGTLLVDPEEMMGSCFNACGGAFGFLAGSFLERHYIRYEIPKDSAYLSILTCVGIAIVYSWQSYFAGAVLGLFLESQWRNFATLAVTVIFVMAVWPMMIMKGAADGWKRILEGEA